MTRNYRAALAWTPPLMDIPESKPFTGTSRKAKHLPAFCRKPNRSFGTQAAFPEPSRNPRNPNRLPGTFPEPPEPSRNLPGSSWVHFVNRNALQTAFPESPRKMQIASNLKEATKPNRKAKWLMRASRHVNGKGLANSWAALFFRLI